TTAGCSWNWNMQPKLPPTTPMRTFRPDACSRARAGAARLIVERANPVRSRNWRRVERGLFMPAFSLAARSVARRRRFREDLGELPRVEASARDETHRLAA